MNIMAFTDRLAASSVVADALQIALESGLFDQLDSPLNDAQLAQRLGWHPAPTAHLLELLWSQGLLDRHPQGWSLPAATRDLLCQNGARFIGDACRYRLQALRDFGQRLPAMLARPLPGYADQLPHDAAWAEAASRQIFQEQRALTADTACALAAPLAHFQRPARMLDMGGGPGLVSVALGQRYPQLSGVVQDLPLTAAVAQQHLQDAGLADRFCAVDRLDEAERFDIIWCSSFLHFVEDVEVTLSQLYRRLRPGGVLISAHARLGPQADQVSRVLPFFLPLLMRGKPVFHDHQLGQLLLQAGFRVEDRGEHPFPLAPLQVHYAFREAN